MQTVKSPLAPAYKQRGGFLPGRVYGWNGRMERPTDVSGWDKTLRDCTDPHKSPDKSRHIPEHSD